MAILGNVLGNFLCIPLGLVSKSRVVERGQSDGQMEEWGTSQVGPGQKLRERDKGVINDSLSSVIKFEICYKTIYK